MELQMTRKAAAYKIHLDIMAAGEVAAEAFSTFCKLLKTMRDDKLYQELEYSSFEAYCENAVGLKYRQAFNYIKVLENFGEQNLQSNAGLGIRKLELLGTVPEESREEFMDENKLQDMTTRQVEAAVKEYKDKLKEAESAAAKSKEWADKQAKYAEESNKRAREAEWELGKKEKSIDTLRADLEYAKKSYQLSEQELKLARQQKSPQVDIRELEEKHQAEIDNLNKKLEEVNKQLHSKPIEAQAVKVAVPVAVKQAIYKKIVDLYEGLLELTNDEILIYAELAVANGGDELEELGKAFKVIEKLESNFYMKRQGII